ncbi:MAG: exosortase family protein XrtG [Lachnospiraceae bacterium]|nr:exosortase family protein XrtG [Lachnospiraceae bacterium]
MIYVEIALFILYIYILTLLKRAKISFLFFLVGSVGMFVFLFLGLNQILIPPLVKAVSVIAGALGSLTGFYDAYFQQGMMFIVSHGETLSLYIDYECVGIIEILAFTCLLWFFPVYKVYEKFLINIIGFAYLLLANVFRIFAICSIIYIFGNDMYYVAHTIVGRIIYYVLSIVLYFFVFTKTQIKRQRVGNFAYGDS